MLELVGRYRIEERIGEGAMADVYRAFDPNINRSLAVKVLKAEFRQNAEYSARFLREAKAAGALSHPHIVTIYDVGELDGYPYIVMELLEGEPLNDILKREGAMAPEQVMKIGLQLAQALAYAHAQGVVHRDIKPSNIVVSPDGESIKLLDFGIARLAENDIFQAESLKTQVGQVLGTPRYMSPEQALGSEIDGRSDLFSVGVVLYEMITGARAFPGSSAATLAIQITQTEPEPLGQRAPQTPRGLQFIVNKLLAKRADRRFANGRQLVDALRNELHFHATAFEEAQTKRTYLPLQVRLTLLLAAITAVVLAGAIGTVLWREHRAMEDVALTSGSVISSFVAQNAALRAVDNAALPPEDRDWAPVAAFVQHASEDPNVRALIVVDADGVIRAASDPSRVGKPYSPARSEPVLRRGADLVVSSSQDARGRSTFRFVRPISYARRTFGQVDVSLSKAELEAAAQVSRLLMIALGLVTLGVVVIATYVSARLLERPILRLKAAFRDVAKGNLDFRISHHRRDEFGELFDGFNAFTAAMQERLDTVETMALDTASANAASPGVGPSTLEAPPLQPTGPFAPVETLTDPIETISESLRDSPFSAPQPPPVNPLAAPGSPERAPSPFAPLPEPASAAPDGDAPEGPKPSLDAAVETEAPVSALDDDRTLIGPAPDGPR